MQRRDHDTSPFQPGAGREQIAVYAEDGWVVIEFLLNGRSVAKRRLSPDNARQFGGDAYDMGGYADIQRQRGARH